MGWFKAENIFEANKIQYYFGKLIAFHFLTISKINHGKYFAHTTAWDKLGFLIPIIFYIWFFLKLFQNPLSITNRSIMFDIGVMLNGKLQILHPAISMMQMFYYRMEYFRIIENIHWIDQKV